MVYRLLRFARNDDRNGVTLVEAVVSLFLMSTLIAAFLVWVKPHGMIDVTLETQAVALAQDAMERFTHEPGRIMELAQKKQVVLPPDQTRIGSGPAAVTVTLAPDEASGLDRIEVRVSYREAWGQTQQRLVALVPLQVQKTIQ
jgi:hypothetical protein